MSMYGVSKLVPEPYIIALINSTYISCYVNSFVNNTQTFQINDARQIPIIIPNQRQIQLILSLFEEAIKIKKQPAIANEDTDNLKKIQWDLDRLVQALYGI